MMKQCMNVVQVLTLLALSLSLSRAGGGLNEYAAATVETSKEETCVGNQADGCLSGDAAVEYNETSASEPYDADSNEAADDVSEGNPPWGEHYTWPTSTSRCGIYLAESTIPNAGLGLYSGINVKKGAQVGFGDAVVTLTDLSWHNDKGVSKLHYIFSDYEWNAKSFAIDNGDTVNVIVAGFGAAANSHPGIANIVGDSPKHDALDLHRSVDPGVGAFSPFFDRNVVSKSPIPAGAELFLDYGSAYFESRASVYGPIPRKDDYVKADEFLQTFDSLVKKHETLPRKALADFWSLITSGLPYESKPLRALPTELATALTAVDTGTREQLFHTSLRTLEWLDQNGRCMDNIRPGLSTIRQAGRGAFATRFLPKGGLVSPSPMVHIVDRNILNMFNYNVNKRGKHIVDHSDQIGHQLLLNYCFGHRSSTLLLCSYGHTTLFINHSWENANAKVVWADDLSTHHKDWLNRSVEELEEFSHAGLAFDFVATRDIMEGEEIFINYGEEWENAWQHHVKHFSAPEGAQDYVSASYLNADKTTPLRTADEHKSDPYPDNVVLRCLFSDYALKKPKGGKFLVYDWDDVDEDTEPYRCRINERTEQPDGSFLYEMQVYVDNDDDDDEDDDDEDLEKGYIIEGAPRESFRFKDRRYTDDQHLRNAFRHPMMIPDDLFPVAWSNV